MEKDLFPAGGLWENPCIPIGTAPFSRLPRPGPTSLFFHCGLVGNKSFSYERVQV